MKVCTRCKEEKFLDSFVNKAASKDGKGSWCKACFAEHAKVKYQNGDRVRKEANKAALVARNRVKMLEFLKENPCIGCGESDPVVLTFDHRNPAEKTRNVSEMFQWSWDAIMGEIAKCDVRCANCHMRRTAHQFGFWKTK